MLSRRMTSWLASYIIMRRSFDDSLNFIVSTQIRKRDEMGQADGISIPATPSSTVALAFRFGPILIRIRCLAAANC
jgi:hypothetical protein